MTDMPLVIRRRPARVWGVFGLAFTAGTLALGAWLWTAPALAQFADQNNLSSRLDRLEDQIAALQQQLAGGAPVVSGVPVAPTQAADFEIRLSQLERTVQQMVGKYEETVFAVTQVRERLEKLSTDLDYRLSQLESKGGDATATRTSETPAPTRPTVAPVPSGGSTGKPVARPAEPTPSPVAAGGNSGPGLGGVSAAVQEQYDEAFGLLRKPDYDQAEKALIAFVAQHHDNPLAANAQYWLGETYYARGKYTEAAIAFAEGLQKYPKSNKAPDDLLKLGMALASLNKKDDACKAFGQFATQFPTAATSLKRRAEQEHAKAGCP